jgi:hypothetical protein
LFDLVFVVVITQLADRLAMHPSWPAAADISIHPERQPRHLGGGRAVQ